MQQLSRLLCVQYAILAGTMMVFLSERAGAIEIVEIEEHWSLEVGEPDGSVSGPQITMIMSPTGDMDNDFFVFTLNYRADPEFTPGGMQVQHWYGDDFEDSNNGSAQGMLSTNNETITWVQKIKLNQETGLLTFDIDDGQSESWGSFGNQGYLRFSLSSQLESLNAYRPSISLEGSGVNFAGNRVKSLTLTKLRWIDSEGRSYHMNAPIDVDADIDP